jgi:subtilase family serine protease
LAIAWACGSVLAAQVPAPTVRIVDPIDEGHRVQLRGDVHPAARARYDRGPVSLDMPMGDLVLVLRRDPARQDAFDKFVAGQYDPASPDYHRWLAPDEVGDRFGPAASDVDAVSNWLRNHGFTIAEITRDRLSIRFNGTAAQVESAFHTGIHNLEVNGEMHIGNMTAPEIPAALAPVVVGVKALHNFFPRPLHRLGGQVRFDRTSGKWRRVSGGDSAYLPHPGFAAQMDIHAQFASANSYGDAIEDITPYDFAQIYNVLPLWKAGKPIDGTGQTIAIAGASNIDLADVAAFRKAFDLPAKTPTVVITNNDPGNCPTAASSCIDDLTENTLDVEWSGAVAKGAKIVLVTSSAPTSTSDPVYLSESYVVNNKTAPILNVSYGECELAMGDAGNMAYNNLWQMAASEGIAVFVASGDAGSPACDQGYDLTDGVPYAAQFGLAVSGLASTPYNTAVGGTDLNWASTPASYWNTSNNSTTNASAKGYIPEVPWNSTCVNPLVLPVLEGDANYLGAANVVDAESACNFVVNNWSTIDTDYGVYLAWLVDTVGGGGGASACTTSFQGVVGSCSGGYGKPVWQAGVPGIPADSQRDLPDVSFFASNGFLGSAYLICLSAGGNACDYSASSEPTAQEVGGTSVASPAMAGVMALINQKAGGAEGNPNPLLYALAARQTWASCSAEHVKDTGSCYFNDIDTGSNAMPCENGSPECTVLYSQDAAGILLGYSANTGYDLATGLGSLNVANVVNAWPMATEPVVSLFPASLSFASTEEGVASVSQTVTVQNTGNSALSLSGSGHGISIAGANASSFSQTNTCGKSLAAGKSCTVTVTLKPAATGALTAKLALVDNGWESPQTVSLTGVGTAGIPAVTLGANIITFGSTAIGSTNTAPAFTLTNSGHATLALASIKISGKNASSFSETTTCGKSLSVGAHCGITVTFKPTASGTLIAAVELTDNAPGSPQSVSLSGQGK